MDDADLGNARRKTAGILASHTKLGVEEVMETLRCECASGGWLRGVWHPLGDCHGPAQGNRQDASSQPPKVHSGFTVMLRHAHV